MDGTYKLVRILPNGNEMQIAPSLSGESLIPIGEGMAAAPEYAEWTLRVIDPEGNTVWENKKSTPGKAEGTIE